MLRGRRQGDIGRIGILPRCGGDKTYGCRGDLVFARHVGKNVRHHNPDVLFFSGDQIYEYVGGYGIYRALSTKKESPDSIMRSCLNYLRKWFLVGLAFGDLMRDRPSICIPDDHDVYQGNIWANGGNPITLKKHASGGYVMHPDFVNCVHRTQCSNLPPPFDPRPIKQGITTYFTDMVFGRIGFAVIADRMFKSGTEGTVATWKGRPDHLKDPKFDVKKLDKPGLKYLGERQLKFLRHHFMQRHQREEFDSISDSAHLQ